MVVAFYYLICLYFRLILILLSVTEAGKSSSAFLDEINQDPLKRILSRGIFECCEISEHIISDFVKCFTFSKLILHKFCSCYHWHIMTLLCLKYPFAIDSCKYSLLSCCQAHPDACILIVTNIYVPGQINDRFIHLFIYLLISLIHLINSFLPLMHSSIPFIHSSISFISAVHSIQLFVHSVHSIYNSLINSVHLLHWLIDWYYTTQLKGYCLFVLVSGYVC